MESIFLFTDLSHIITSGTAQTMVAGTAANSSQDTPKSATASVGSKCHDYPCNYRR